ncbi:YcaO-like family protein [Geobacillus stearothermophilus]|uniref:YcaO domain-containing protein n=1 Tax=Parageobacillus toebii TaxID=153151 RepID=A0A150MT08_9BACL|nr:MULTISPECIES: YcaO-like family protein [Bacillaceae]KOR94824.1 hypothetical protein N231_05445 [Geobacillus stearothermophilus ATCC 12980]KYD27472.1 hypothetical protein B4110_3764 [Parageobacillus toebii]MED4880752.1 YcaO-like family protein [Geobacillus stearothermophilus]MED5010677.1 YcaO-like family protein [Geobacillus stearothermophilus]MED5015233.1 YcaO-like family protein [Geobacillus stearothermophilus]
MYKVHKIGAPFLLKEMRVYRSLFQDAPKKVSAIPSVLDGAHGGATHFQINRVTKAALGEHIERLSLYLNLGNFKNKTVKALDLVTLEVVDVPLKKVLLCRDARIFTDDEVEDINYYSDSCGVASHISSFKTINTAFLEFFERQCLIHNWLTQSPGRQIRLETITSRTIQELINRAKKFVDDIFFFDISLHPYLYVILSLGLGEKYMAMGVSAGWSLEEAIIKSLEEFFQFFGERANKYYLDDDDIIFKGACEEEQDKLNAPMSDPHYYSSYFFNTFTPSKLKESYSYLFEHSKLVDYENKYVDLKSHFMTYIKNISQDLQLDILCAFIPCVLQGVPTKIVKILTNKGYPHMLTEIINPREVIFSKVLGQYNFPNEHKPIPFP